MNCRDESRESMSSHNTGVIRSVDTFLLFSMNCFDQKWEPRGTRPSNTSLRGREEECKAVETPVGPVRGMPNRKSKS